MALRTDRIPSRAFAGAAALVILCGFAGAARAVEPETPKATAPATVAKPASAKPVSTQPTAAAASTRAADARREAARRKQGAPVMMVTSGAAAKASYPWAKDPKTTAAKGSKPVTAPGYAVEVTANRTRPAATVPMKTQAPQAATSFKDRMAKTTVTPPVASGAKAANTAPAKPMAPSPAMPAKTAPNVAAVPARPTSPPPGAKPAWHFRQVTTASSTTTKVPGAVALNTVKASASYAPEAKPQAPAPKPAPAASAPVQVAAQPMPASTKPMPTAMKPMPTATKPMPTAMKPMPAATKPGTVVMKPEPAPVAAKPQMTSAAKPTAMKAPATAGAKPEAFAMAKPMAAKPAAMAPKPSMVVAAQFKNVKAASSWAGKGKKPAAAATVAVQTTTQPAPGAKVVPAAKTASTSKTAVTSKAAAVAAAASAPVAKVTTAQTTKTKTTTAVAAKGSGKGSLTTSVQNLGARFMEQREQYVYNSLNRRDPFASLVSGSFEGEVGTPLLDVSSMKLVGIVWGASDKFALVEDGHGHGFVLRVGDPVLNGYIAGMTKEELIVKQSSYGDTQTVTIQLQRKEGASNAQ
jgi:hypothetical protein